MSKEPPRKKGVRWMATQLQATPTLYGKDAEAVLKQIQLKPTNKQKEAAQKRKAFFASVPKRDIKK